MRLRVHLLWGLASTLALWSAAGSEAPVADAAMRGDVAEVEALLRSGADVNAAQGDGMTALHWAAELGNTSLAEMLIAAGAYPDAVTRLGDFTALHVAAGAGQGGIVEVLAEAGADLDARTSTGGVTPLHYAAASGSQHAVAVLLEHGVRVDARESAWLQTPLMFAAAAGRTEVVRALAAAGADPSLTARVMDMDAREQQDRADQRRQEEIQSRILTARDGRAPERRGGYGEPTGARQAERQDSARSAEEAATPSRQDINNQQRDRVPSSRFSHAQLVGGYGGLTALHLAVREGHIGTAEALLESGADINQPTEGDGTPPLLMATVNGHFDLAMRLFERGADPNLSNDANATPLYTVINAQWIPKSRHPQPADYLQQQVTYMDLVRAFLGAGVDVNVRLDKQLWFTTFGDDYLRTDRMGATPFWRAAYALDLPLMELLVEHGADPSIPTKKTVRPRFGAGAIRNIETGANDPSGLPPVPPGGPGVYAIHAASGVGYGEGFAANIHRVVPDGWLPAVRYLVEELGADVNQRDHNGYTAMHHAAARGDDEMIRYLVSQGGDVMVLSRRGQTTVDMANGPVQRISPFPSTIALLESLGAINNHNCVSCE
ncbi:MAG: ankyrin repeat domain-containing protein [Gemmatimonadota bacterium]|nr:ankyrin repeat domain-containing protein [Gemmatimonadota bacterium]MDE3006988.1 ankyrin repeat domain-containing protein [Gemmatimonadota bacterium]MDE3014851.1 ankyrin repeat domain-containing protein [Gemmatimonadota bacterium]